MGHALAIATVQSLRNESERFKSFYIDHIVNGHRKLHHVVSNHIQSFPNGKVTQQDVACLYQASATSVK
jgi:hypothetical protein